jgi:hypothetical protein
MNTNKWRNARMTCALASSVTVVALFAPAISSSAASNSHDTYSAAANAACQPITVYSQPPANFDTLTASSADLRTYGLPPRPPGNNAGALATWTSMVTDAKSYSAPQPVCSTDTRSAIYSGFWAAHVVPNSNYSGDHFTWLSAPE